jgi:hypothetical protein
LGDIFNFCGLKKAEGIRVITCLTARVAIIGQSRLEFFAGGAFASISALEVTAAQAFYFRAAVTPSAEIKVMNTGKVKAPPTKLLDRYNTAT